MSRGYPDYAANVGKSDDNLFLQATTPGPIWFKDDFDTAQVKWTSGGAVVNHTTDPNIVATTTSIFSGDSSLYIFANIGATFILNRRIPVFLGNSQISIECCFMIEDNDKFKDRQDSFLPIYFSSNSGTETMSVNVSYNPRDGNWYYRGAGGIRTLIGNFPINDAYWHFIRLVIDPTIGEYVLLRVDYKIWTLKGQAYHIQPLVTDVRTYIRIMGYSEVAEQPQVFVDNYKIRYGMS